MSVDISGINREEFIKLEEARDRYIEIVDKLSIHTHAEFCEAYNALAEGYYSQVSQSTVSANFSKFDIRKNPKTKLYAHKTPVKYKTAANRYMFSSLCSKISRPSRFSELLYFKIDTELGAEQTIARIVYEFLKPGSGFIVVPCMGCVIVMHAEEEKLNLVNKKIRSYINYRRDRKMQKDKT